jgi:phosphatidyl-myo-inositol alpha-mannosyltransferase
MNSTQLSWKWSKPMKIALVTPYDYPYPGGVTEHIRSLDREFRRLGHETRIIAPSSEPQAELDPNVIRVNGDITSFRFNGSIARISLSPGIRQNMHEILAREGFDVVHIHQPEVPMLSLMALMHSQAVTVGTFHALMEANGLAAYAYPLLMLPVLEHLDGRIFVSEPLRDKVATYFPGETRVIPNGIDFANFASPDILPVPEFNDGRPNVLFVGRMDERKGFRHLLLAYPHIKQSSPQVRLLVAGAYQPEEVASFRRYARRYGLEDIHFVGKVSGKDLPRYYRTATVFSAPSTGSESFGIILLEAMAAGLPIIASDIAGYRSVLTHDKEGWLVEPGNNIAIAEAITGLINDPHLRAKMASAGKQTAQRYDWKVVAPLILEYYDELIEARSNQKFKHKPNGTALKLRLQPSVKIPIALNFSNLSLARGNVNFERQDEIG